MRAGWYTLMLILACTEAPRSSFARCRGFSRAPADDAMMRDVLLAVRADEANHRDVNHTFSSMKQDGEENPFNYRAQ